MLLTSRVPSLQPYRVSLNNVALSIERLQQGRRISRAAHDAAGLAIANKMHAQIRGHRMLGRNLQDNLSLLQTAESGISEAITLLQRMRELTLQASSSVLSESDRAALEKEGASLAKALDGLASSTVDNGRVLLQREIVQHSEVREGNVQVELPGLLGENQLGSLTTQPMGQSVVWSPDGSGFLYRCQSNYLHVYQEESVTSVSMLRRLATGTTGTWSSDGSRVFYVDALPNTNQLRLRETSLATGQADTLFEFAGIGSSPVTAQNEPWIAVSSGGSVSLLDYDDPSRIATWGTSGNIRLLGFSADSNYLYARNTLDGQFLRLEISRDEAGELHLSHDTSFSLTGGLSAWAVSRDNLYIAIGDNNGFRVINTIDGSYWSCQIAGGIGGVTFTPEGFILTVDREGTLAIHDPISKEMRELDNMGTAIPVFLHCSPTGELLYGAGSSSLQLRPFGVQPYKASLPHAPTASSVTAPAGLAPHVSGNELSWDWRNLPLFAGQHQLSYEYLYTWEEDNTRPLLSLGGDESLGVTDVSSHALGLGTWTDGLWQADLEATLQQVDRALAHLSSERSTIGVWQNRLTHRLASTEASWLGDSASLSRLEDLDMAREMINHVRATLQADMAMHAASQTLALRARVYGLLFGEL